MHLSPPPPPTEPRLPPLSRDPGVERGDPPLLLTHLRPPLVGHGPGVLAVLDRLVLITVLARLRTPDTTMGSISGTTGALQRLHPVARSSPSVITRIHGPHDAAPVGSTAGRHHPTDALPQPATHLAPLTFSTSTSHDGWSTAAPPSRLTHHYYYHHHAHTTSICSSASSPYSPPGQAPPMTAG